MTGKVKSCHPTWGFITGDDGVDHFFHESDQVDDLELRPGDRVSFTPVEPTPIKGPRASDVSFLSTGNLSPGGMTP
jgi:cold shock CspA family protein